MPFRALRRWQAVVAGAWALGLLAAAAPASRAESIYDAMASAYQGNPTLRAERARQRATDEQVPQALSGWRPTVTAQDTIGYQLSDSDNVRQPSFLGQSAIVNPKASETTPATLSINLSQPVFRGFKTVEGVRQAKAAVRAGRQNLLVVEQQVLFQATQAYMNVLLGRQVVMLRQRNVSVLRQELSAAQERFSAGDITRTDVAQARARLSFAQVNLAFAKTSLGASVANYIRVIGHAPGTLAYPKLPTLPGSEAQGHEIAKRINPNLLAAAFVEQAAQHNVKVVRGDLLPEVSLQASATQAYTDLSRTDAQKNQEVRVTGVLTIPIYQAGRVSSEVRQAKQVASQRRLEVLETARLVREAVGQSWANLIGARQRIAAATVEVAAQAQALEGIKQEYLVGSRTTLDVLDAEQELLVAQEQLVNAERDLIVFGFQLLAAMGRLTAPELRLAIDLYDPTENYRDVKNRLIGESVGIVE